VDSTEKKCCHEMTPEEKAFQADWENWATQTEEKKAELVATAKQKLDEKRAACEAKKAALTEEEKAECAKKEAEMTEECKAKKAEMEAKKAELDAKLANWANLTVEEQKVLIDEVKANCKCHGKCQKGEGEHKCQKAEEGGHEGCPNKK
ncbi:MAG: hypothetical protein PHR53_08020, partial [Bacteroidales bacterium]|nr:hypothetical protein [Bacteroidales bacterium]